MSGGSYNYLSYVTYDDLSDLLDHRRDLEEMVERLAGLGYAQDAAEESLHLLRDLRKWEVNAGVAVKRLRDIWHAVEWWDSADSTEEAVLEALAKYRGA